jgi:hypothetical protein
MQKVKSEKGFTPKQQLPETDGAKIWFIEKENNMRFEGLWVAAEEMFFIGFEDKGYFRFKHEISKWGYLNNEDNGREQGLEKP